MAKKKLTASETRQKFYNSFNKSKELLKKHKKRVKKNNNGPLYTFGIDLSLSRTGVSTCVYKTGKFYPEAIQSKQKTRYLKMQEILELLCNHNFSLLIGLENYSFGFRQGQSIMTSIAELGGVVRYGLGKFQSRILQISPMQLKKWVLGVGRGDKNLILLGVYKRYGIGCKTDDEADAIVLADMARSYALLVLKDSLESNDDKYLLEYLKNPPKLFKKKGIKIRKTQWEVLKALVTEQGDKLDQFDIEDRKGD